MRKIYLLTFTVLATLLVTAPAFAASWTHLGGDPLLPSIKGSGQTARNDFVKKSRSVKFKTAMKRAGLNARARSAVASAISKGKFSKCGLHYGDKFVRMAFGAAGVLVDRNVTFKDPRYRSHPASAFCLTVKVTTKKGNTTTTRTIRIKVPFKCLNFSIVSITTKRTTTTPASKPTPPVFSPPVLVPSNSPPKISCVYPAHVYVKGSVFVYCEASDKDGDDFSVSVESDSKDPSGHFFANIAGMIPQDTRWDNTPTHASPCPAGTKCFRFTLWGVIATPLGQPARVIAKATSAVKNPDGTHVTSEPFIGFVPIVEDDFGQ
jgi:hypothetical protein